MDAAESDVKMDVETIFNLLGGLAARRPEVGARPSALPKRINVPFVELYDRRSSCPKQ